VLGGALEAHIFCTSISNFGPAVDMFRSAADPNQKLKKKILQACIHYYIVPFRDILTLFVLASQQSKN
jgi:hypothetical protein